MKDTVTPQNPSYDDVIAAHARIAPHIHRTPEGFDAGRFVSHASERYGVAFGAGLGQVAGKVFRIGHLGSLTAVMALSGIATSEMVMADLGLITRLGSGVAAAH